MVRRQLRREDYTVGWVCALPVELDAAKEMLDEEHETPFTDTHDTNIYTCGRVGEHNVVIACLPGGMIGTSSAAVVAVQLKSTFTSTRFGLLVGVGAGVPSKEADIRLGDVVISKPHKTHGGVVQYDFGKATPSGFERSGYLNAPPTVLLNAVVNLQATPNLEFLSQIQRNLTESDNLFDPNYRHVGGVTCAQCSTDYLIERGDRKHKVMIHYGTIASGNQVIRDSLERDRLSGELGGVLCFEMEAAGLMNSYPCLVIRGVCDYADSHKNKTWQSYAAKTAAACAKQVLSIIPPTEVTESKTVDEAIGHDTEKDQECIKQLRRGSTNPYHDKARIEATKGGLIKGSYRWILNNLDFQRWRDDPESQILWIKGDPGKGKTMLLCGIIDEFDSTPGVRSIFFCQGTDSRINSSMAVLRGLIYLLVEHQPSLVSHIRKEHDRAGEALFQDANSWVAMSDIFKNMLQDLDPETVYLCIDALDECLSGLMELLDLVIRISSSLSHVKWLLSSRNRLDIEQKLRPTHGRERLSLELKENADQVSQAVDVYIDQKLSEVEVLQDSALRGRVRAALHSKADGTFLWVSLVISELMRPNLDPLQVVEEVPSGLHGLYDRMLEQILQLRATDTELCQRVLSLTILARRPLHLSEVGGLCGWGTSTSGMVKKVGTLVAMCGSFLTVRNNHVYLVHQSAKDYLSALDAKFISPEKTHQLIVSQSLQLIGTLQRDIYQVKKPSVKRGDIKTPDPDPLEAIRYSCANWIYHLSNVASSNSTRKIEELEQGGAVEYLFKKRYLYWVEALSLCRSVSTAIASITTLENLIQARASSPELLALVRDARRFVMAHQWVIENYPLQLYVSAIAFSPTRSLVRQNFRSEEPKWVEIQSNVQEEWNACLRTLEGHSSRVYSVAFSHDSTRLVSASRNGLIILWDTITGANIRQLSVEKDTIVSVAFCLNSTRLVSSTCDGKIWIWDADSGEHIDTLKSLDDSINHIAFSPDSTLLASTAQEGTIKIWEASHGKCFQTLKDPEPFVRSENIEGQTTTCADFSEDSTRLVSTSGGFKIKIWDVKSGASLRIICQEHICSLVKVAFSHKSSRVVAVADDGQVWIWDTNTGVCLRKINGEPKSWPKFSVAFSQDSARFVMARRAIHIRDAKNGSCIWKIEGSLYYVSSVAFASEGNLFASTSGGHAVKVWDISKGTCLQTLEGHGSQIKSLVFSHDSSYLASAAQDGTVKIWDLTAQLRGSQSQGALRTLVDRTLHNRLPWIPAFSRHADHGVKGSGIPVRSLIFSADSTRVAIFEPASIRIYNVRNGKRIQYIKFLKEYQTGKYAALSRDFTRLAFTDKGGIEIWGTFKPDFLEYQKRIKWSAPHIPTLIFSDDATEIVSFSVDDGVSIWDVERGVCLQKFLSQGDTKGQLAAAFSHNSIHIALAVEGHPIRIFETVTCKCVRKFGAPTFWKTMVLSMAFSSNNAWLASASMDLTVKIWDIQSNTCICILTTECLLYNISFNPSGTHLHTMRGSIRLGDLSLSTSKESSSKPKAAEFEGLSLTDSWISQGSEQLLWLPVEYLPIRSAVSGNTIAIGRTNGELVRFNIDLDELRRIGLIS